MSIAAEILPVVCSRCHRTISVLVSDLYPPSFRHVEDQAECPEIRDLRGQSGAKSDLAVCDALRLSLEAKLARSEVAAVAHGDVWYVVRRTLGRPSQLYSPRQARAQAEVWHGHGQTELGDQFRRAADDAERRQLGGERGVQGKPRGTVTIYVMVLAVLGFAIWYFVLRPPTQVALQTPDQVQAPAEPKVLATRTPEASPVTPQSDPGLTPTAPVQPAPAAAPPPPQVAINPPAQTPVATPSATPAPAPTDTTRQAPLQPGPSTNQSTPPPAAVTTPPPAQPPPAQEALIAPVQAPSPQPIVEPEMVQLRGGTFAMGSNDDISEKPVHQVTVKPFAISKFPITVIQWNECVIAKACVVVRTGKDDTPVTNLSWSDTQQFISWLVEVTHKQFRLPSEAEWEYAARGGTATTYWWGDKLQVGMANCKGCGEPYDAKQPSIVGTFSPNPFGLYEMGGGVAQWVADCWHKNYRGAPADGSAWVEDSNCPSHVIRSGSWRNDPSYIRPASRDRYDTNARYLTLGFRVARSF
jgi:formylglycine-generating enzyme required for sulfatase activity